MNSLPGSRHGAKRVANLWPSCIWTPIGARLWPHALADVARQTRGAGIRFGVIYKGEPSDVSDVAFTTAALTHADEVEAVLAGQPDDVILQSWENYPRHALPDTDPGSMTGLLRAYQRGRTRLATIAGNIRSRCMRTEVR